MNLVSQSEPGTLGAALLGGLADGTITDIDKKLSEVTDIRRRVRSHPRRASLYDERIRTYEAIVKDLMSGEWSRELAS